MSPARPTITAKRRQGFTLIELLVVIAILGVLVSLLVGALSGSRRAATLAKVRVEISALESAITNFRNEYGVEPPGTIRLYYQGTGWTTAVTGVDEVIRLRSRDYIRRVWPNFDFDTAGGIVMTQNADLNGAECLVFFLGGMLKPGSSVTTLDGFSRNPTQPFIVGGTNRNKPYYEFPAGTRLIDKDGDGFFEYLDPIPGQTSPYLYFDSNDGQSYSTWTSGGVTVNIDNFNDGFLNNATPFAGRFWGVAPTGGNWMPLCYYVDSNLTTPYMPTKYQIISPGYGGVGAVTPDIAYGNGGQFNPKAPGNLATPYDADNITNFHPGPLGQ